MEITNKDWRKFLISAIVVALISVVYNLFLTDANALIIEVQALEKILVFVIIGLFATSFIRLKNTFEIFVVAFLVAIIPTFFEYIIGSLLGQFFGTMIIRMLGALLGIFIVRLLYK